MCGVRCLFLTAALVAAAAILLPALEALTARRYPVHQGGCVLVTGASSGIGRAAALELLKHEFQVFAGVRADKDGAGLRSDAGPLATRLHVLTLDVTKPAHIDQALEALEGCGQPVVGLVNNAGLTAKKPMETVTSDHLRQTFEVNFFGLVALTQRLLPLLRKGQGRIVNVGSVAGSVVTKLQGPYCASKYALEAVSDALRLELGPSNISVSMVNPGYVTTALRWKALEQMSPSSEAEEMLYGDVLARERAKEPKLREWGSPCCAETDADILHALTSPTPRTRYYPGTIAKDVPARYMIPVAKFLSMHPVLERMGDSIKAMF